MQHEPRQLERRFAVVGQRTADGKTVAAHHLRRGVLPRRDTALNLPYAPHIFLDLGLRARIGGGDRLRGFLEIVVVTELVRHAREDLLHREADRLLGIRDHSVNRHGQGLLDLAQQVNEIGGAHAVEAARQQHRPREAVAHHPQHILVLVWLQPINGEDDVTLVGEVLLETRMVGQVHGEEFLVASKEIRDGALSNGDPRLAQSLVDLGDRAVVPVAQPPDAGDDVETELVVGQGPRTFLLGAVGLVVAGTLRVGAADDGLREAADGVEGGDGALALVEVPQAAATRGTSGADRG